MSFTAPGVLERIIIKNNGFYPDLNTADFAEACRTDGTVSLDRARYVIRNAIQTVNMQLRVWTIIQKSHRFSKLDDVPAEQIDDESELVQLYRHAVYSEAKAQLFEHYRDYDSTPNSNIRADLSTQQIDDFRRDSRNAISDLVGRNRLTCELI